MEPRRRRLAEQNTFDLSFSELCVKYFQVFFFLYLNADVTVSLYVTSSDSCSNCPAKRSKKNEPVQFRLNSSFEATVTKTCREIGWLSIFLESLSKILPHFAPGAVSSSSSPFSFSYLVSWTESRFRKWLECLMALRR